MSTAQRFDTIEIDLSGDGLNQPQSRKQALAPGRPLKQVVVTHLPPGVELSLHFGGQGRPFRIQKEGDTFEFFDEAERDDGIFWSTDGSYTGYIVELVVTFQDVATLLPGLS